MGHQFCLVCRCGQSLRAAKVTSVCTGVWDCVSRPTIRPAEELLGTVCQLPTWGRDSAPTLLPKWCCHRGNETNCESEFSCTPKIQICICHINSLPYLNLSHLTYCPENKSHRVKIALFRHKLHQCISHFFLIAFRNYVNSLFIIQNLLWTPSLNKNYVKWKWNWNCQSVRTYLIRHES